MKLLSILAFIICFNASAQVQHITKGTPAPYDGHLFTEAKAREVRKELLEKDGLVIFTKALLENEVRYKQIIRNNNAQVDLLKEQNEKLVKRAQNTENLPLYERVLWFGLGMAVTGLTLYGAAQIVK